jgi:hypothetical protein
VLRADAAAAAALRRELSERNRQYAATHRLPHALSYGGMPAVCYEPTATAHGNFHPASYGCIVANSDWQKRLKKTHTSKRSSLPSNERGFWAELDSCNSSDALLMNIFCHPAVTKASAVQHLLGIEPGVHPVFGWKAHVPLRDRKVDRTEVDMKLGDLLVEAKLTETSFQTKAKDVVKRYRDFTKVFALSALPQDKSTYLGYQLIRNLLAAYANDLSFCVLHDARRPDLREMWFTVMRAVKVHELRLRAKVLTYQELARVLPPDLQPFLEEKYGIIAE